MAGGGRQRGRSGLLALMFALVAVLLQVNAPVARAAAPAMPELGVLCHDAGGRSDRQAPTPVPADRCDHCTLCCAQAPAALPQAAPVVPTPVAAVLAVLRPAVVLPAPRGPPATRPPSTGPPPALA